MSLSADIRKGLKLSRYKIKYKLYDGEGGHCVMGCAFLGRGRIDPNMSTWDYPELWPKQSVLGLKKEDLPRAETHDVYATELLRTAVHLNNDTEMSREGIADWIEVMENKYLSEESEELTPV